MAECPDNTVLLDYMKSEFNHGRVRFQKIDDHLGRLNNSVAANTKFRYRFTGIVIGVSAVASAAFAFIQSLI